MARNEFRSTRLFSGVLILSFATSVFLQDALQQSAEACPFCSAVQMTISQELEQADVAVIAQLVEPMPDLPQDEGRFATGPLPTDMAKFKIIEKLRGAEKLGDAEIIDVVYFGEDGPEKRFLITGIIDGRVDWTTPLPLSPRGVEYVKQLGSVAESGAERLAFFQEYLEDADPLLGQDAYDEFARAPYAEVIALGPQMHHDRLLDWINDPAVGPSGRRLYLTMLGICGKQEDVAMLERMLKYDHSALAPGIATTVAASIATGSSYGAATLDELIRAEERRKKESLDALIACYLKLTGPSGLGLVNAKFLGNPEIEYKYMHAAIMAMRFHASETDVIPREQLIESMRLVLDNPDFADQIVPDLAQWEDWAIMPRLVKMFKDATEEDWIRQPVASYLLVAAEQPGDTGSEASAALEELETIDAQTIDRARSLAAFSMLAVRGGPPRVEATGDSKVAEGGAETQATASSEEVSDNEAIPETVNSVAANATDGDTIEPTDRISAGGSSSTNNAGQVANTTTTQSTDAADESAVEETAVTTPNRLTMIGVPLLAAVALLGVFAAILRGGDVPPPNEAPTSESS